VPADWVQFKADVQGFAQSVLEDATRTLASVQLLEVEFSLVNLDQDGPLYTDMIEYLRKLRYIPIWFQRGFSDASNGRDCYRSMESRLLGLPAVSRLTFSPP
jgi:hypothetical protein